MSIQFADAFNQLIREKRIDRELLMETLQAGFASAAKKKHGPNAEVLLEDDGHGSVELYLVKNVVKEVEDDSIEISVEEAQEFALSLLRKHEAALHEIARRLDEDEVIEGSEVASIVANAEVTPEPETASPAAASTGAP